MTRLHHVKRARRDYPDIEVKKGEPYFWWKFKNCPKQYSKEAPRQAQLCRSAWEAAICDLNDVVVAWDGTDAESFIEEVKYLVEEMGSQAQESLDNMPESLQEGPTGELLRERSENAESVLSELDSIDVSGDCVGDDVTEAEILEDNERVDSIKEAVTDALGNLG